MLFFTSCFQLNLIEYKVDSKSRKRNGAGGVGGEKRLGYQEEDKGSKRRRRIGVRGGPVEGEREERGKTTLTQYELIMQKIDCSNLKNTPFLIIYINFGVILRISEIPCFFQ